MKYFFFLCFILYLIPLVKAVFVMGLGVFNVIQFVVKVIGGKTLTSRPSPKMQRFYNRANNRLGGVEYTTRFLRNYVCGSFFAVYIFLKLFVAATHGSVLITIPDLWAPILFLWLTLYTNRHKIFVSLKMAEIGRVCPAMHPGYFFKVCRKFHGPFPYEFDYKDVPVIHPEGVSFKKDTRATQSALTYLPIFFDTAFLAHTCIRTFWFVGREFAKEVFDVMTSMWGKRLLETCRAGFKATGLEKLEGLPGKNILVFNHKSQLDFALGFFALSEVRLASGRPIRPRFVVAKDHFLDNPMVYQLLGLGKLIESMGMIFVERKKGKRAIQMMRQVAKDFLHKDIDIAIFPQGTRAEGNVDRSGKRRDAGYYTTVAPHEMDSDLGHLRKGTAYLAVDVLLEMARQGMDEPLNLIFIGIHGAASSIAKQSSRIQTEVDIHYTVGEVMTLTADFVAGMGTDVEDARYLEAVADIQGKIDRNLADALHIHESLRYRFLLDLKGYFRFSEDRLAEVRRGLGRIEASSPIVYQILDRVYACPPQEWNKYLSELSQILLDGSPLPRFGLLRSDVTTRMLELLKKKVHGKRVRRVSLKLENKTSQGNAA